VQENEVMSINNLRWRKALPLIHLKYYIHRHATFNPQIA